jgi:uncharacterized protein
MRFEWDEAKDLVNQRKHGLSFRDVTRVFADPLRSTDVERIVGGEVRFQTFGTIAGVQVVMVAHVDRDEDGEEIVRIISARTATKCERRIYEDQNG